MNLTTTNILPNIKIPLYRVGNPFFNLAGFFPLSSDDFSMTASPALQEALAFKYAVEMVNSDDSVLPNVTVVYQIRDVGFSTRNCFTSAIEILENNITMIIGRFVF